MKIAYASSSNYFQSGAERWMLELATGSVQKGYEVSILAAAGDEAFEEWFRRNDVRFPIHAILRTRPPRTRLYRSIPRFGLQVIASMWRVFRFVRKEKVDIVHVNELLDAYLLIPARIAGAKTVCHVRVVLERPRWVRGILRALARTFANRIVCVSQAVKDLMFPKTRHAVVSYDGGPNVADFAPRRIDRAKVRRDLGVPDDGFLVISVGKISPNKGQNVLVETLDHLRQLGVNAHLLIVGRPMPGYEQSLRAMKQSIQDRGLTDHVTHHAFVESVADAMRASDVFAHVPVHHDPFPGVVLEAMSLGLPVVGSMSGGIPEQIADGATGLLVPRNDAAALADALESLHGDVDLRHRIGEAAASAVPKLVSTQDHLREMDGLYRSLADP